MKFKAIQHNKTFKVKARMYQEATEKLGIKGTMGLEFNILKVGGEVSEDPEDKQGFEQEVEWEVEAALPTFKDFKQL